MHEHDREPILAIALLAAMADGMATTEERDRLRTLATDLGIADFDALAGRVSLGHVSAAEQAAKLSDEEAKRTAYETAVAICTADGAPTEAERRFLAGLRTELDVQADVLEREAAGIAGAPVAAEVGTGEPASPAGLDDLIMKRAMLTGALELLPDRLANVAILPVQLRLVYQVGQAFGQQLDADQVKDLAGTLGIGAAAQVAESAVRKLVGALARGMFGRTVGGTTGLAAGAAVSFATTYALGHVARQYYAQGRTLSAADLRALFARFQSEAQALFPKVQQEMEVQAKGLDVRQLFGLGR